MHHTRYVINCLNPTRVSDQPAYQTGSLTLTQDQASQDHPLEVSPTNQLVVTTETADPRFLGQQVLPGNQVRVRFNLLTGLTGWHELPDLNLEGYIKAILYQQSAATLWLAGHFDRVTYQGQTWTNLSLVGWLPTQRRLICPLPNLTGQINAMVLVGDWLYLGGLCQLGSYQNLLAYRVKDHQLVSPGQPNGEVLALLSPASNQLVVGGHFSTISQNLPVSNLAYWDGQAWSDLNGGVSGNLQRPNQVRALALADNQLWVGGDFLYAGQHANLTSSTNLISHSWPPQIGGWSALPGSGLNRPVNSLTIADNKLYVGGEFTAVAFGRSQISPYLVAYHWPTNNYQSLPTLTSSVKRVIKVSDRLLVITNSQLLSQQASSWQVLQQWETGSFFDLATDDLPGRLYLAGSSLLCYEPPISFKLNWLAWQP